MMDYIKEMMECLGRAKPKARGNKSSAYPMNLFVVDEGCGKLRKEKI